jgi:hypothetical protein
MITALYKKAAAYEKRMRKKRRREQWRWFLDDPDSAVKCWWAYLKGWWCWCRIGLCTDFREDFTCGKCGREIW